MCNIVAIAVAILIAQASILAALIALGIAIILSIGTHLSAFSSQAPMITAAISLGVAVVALLAARWVLSSCKACTAQANALDSTLVALAATLGAQGIVIGVGIAVAPIPGLAAVAALVVLLALIAQAFLWGYL